MSARAVEIDGQSCVLTVTRDISDRKEGERLLQLSETRLQQMVKDVAHAMGRIVESRDPYTHGHQQRVAQLSLLIGVEMELSADDLNMLEMAALVHDVGKLAVPTEILNKPGILSDLEMSLIRVHSERGYEILRDIEFGWPIADIVRQHHERMDGSGYPLGLSGDDILPMARILCVADVVEAMASHRPYRPALGLVSALAEVDAGVLSYDRDVVAALTRLSRRGSLDFLVQ
jgi:putative nucleotidyltransferase with HDIG domain